MKIDKLFDVKGRVTVVTGGASGIGLAYVEAMAENGAPVTMMDIDEVGMARETARLKAVGADVRAMNVNFMERSAVNAAFAEIDDHYGQLDVLFANVGMDAGVGFLGMDGERLADGQIENIDDEQWDRVVFSNLTSVMATMKAAVPIMKRSGGGRIIVTTSTAAVIVNALASAAYYPAKAGAAQLVRRFALELAGFGILVNAVAPGGIVTNIAGGILKNPEVQKAVAPAIPLHRLGQPDDLKGIALFLASDASRYITGVQIVVDGGSTLGKAD